VDYESPLRAPLQGYEQNELARLRRKQNARFRSERALHPEANALVSSRCRLLRNGTLRQALHICAGTSSAASHRSIWLSLWFCLCACNAMSQLGQSRQNSMRAYEVRFRTYCDRRAPLVGHVELHRQAVIKTPVPRSCASSSPFSTGKIAAQTGGRVQSLPTNSPSSGEIHPTALTRRANHFSLSEVTPELCQALPRKILSFRFSERYDHLPASCCHQEGRRDRHDVGNGERWTRGFA